VLVLLPCDCVTKTFSYLRSTQLEFLYFFTFTSLKFVSSFGCATILSIYLLCQLIVAFVFKLF
jgi:hypothetical protein